MFLQFIKLSPVDVMRLSLSLGAWWLREEAPPQSLSLFQGRSCVFQQDNAKPHTAAITTAWLHSRRVRVLNWPACSSDLSPIKNIWCIIKWKIRQKRPWTLQQLVTYIACPDFADLDVRWNILIQKCNLDHFPTPKPNLTLE